MLITGNDARLIELARAGCNRRGWETFVCDGPSDGHSCPLPDGGACPVVESAQLVVNGLDPGDPRVGDFLLSLADRYPDLPVVDPADLSP